MGKIKNFVQSKGFRLGLGGAALAGAAGLALTKLKGKKHRGSMLGTGHRRSSSNEKLKRQVQRLRLRTLKLKEQKKLFREQMRV